MDEPVQPASTPPPIPPVDRTCPNCGNLIPARLPHCSVCGYGMRPVARKSVEPPQLLVVVAFTFVGLPAAFLSLRQLASFVPGFTTTSELAFVALCLGVFALLLWLLVSSFRKRD